MKAATLARGLATALTLASAVRAAEPVAFDVPAGSPTRAILILASQGGLSIGGDVAACGDAMRGLRGRMDATTALRRLLAGTPCEAQRVDPTSFRIRARVPPPPTPARSTPAPPNRARPLEEVVVTADRRRTPLDRFAGTVEVEPGDALARSGRTDLAALAGVDPALSVTNLGPGRDKYFLRGVSDGVFTGVSPPTVAIYLDDLPLTYNAPDPDLRLVDVDRVEALAGPQGALYGAGAIGGVLRIVPNAPRLDRAEGEVAASGVSVAHGGEGAGVEGWANAPIVPGTLGLRLAAYAERDPGWLDVPALGSPDANRTARLGGRAALLWRLSEVWSVQFSMAGQALDTADAQYVLAGAPPLTRATRTLEPHDNDFATMALTVRADLAAARLKLSAARVTHRATTLYAADDGLQAFGAAPGAIPATYVEGDRRGLTFVEATASSWEGGRSSWLLGAFLATSGEKADARLGFGSDAPPLYRERRKDAFGEAAVFGEYGLRIGERLTLRLGARLSSSTVTTTSLVSQPALTDAARAFRGEASTLRILPRAAADLQMTPHLFAYADVADGYRPAGLNAAGPLEQAFDTPSGPPRDVRSDTARAYEAGVRWTPTKRLKLSGSLFYTDWLGVRSDQYSAYGLPYTVNVGDAVIDGGTVSFDWAPGAGVRLKGSAFVADPQLTRDRNLTFPSRSDAGLPGVADVGASLDLGWTRTLGDGATLRAALRAAYVGPSTATFDAAPRGRFGDYVDGGLSAELRRGRLTLGVTVANLADQSADTFAFGNPFSLARRIQLTPLRPRTVTLRIARSF